MNDFETPFPNLFKKKKKIFAARVLFKSVMYSFAIFGILFILLLLAVFGLIKQDTGVVKIVPNKAVLQVNFDNNYSEVPGDDILYELADVKSMSFYDLIKAINIAALDKRVKALVGEVNISGLGMAQIQDLRSAIQNFKKMGKKTYLYSMGMGSFGNGTSEYYLASGFDEIWMQPNTEVGITGLDIEVPFFRGLLDKVGISPEFYTRYEYKTAVSSLMDKEFTPQFKGEMNRLGSSLYNQFISDVSTDRKIAKDKLKKLVNEAPIFAEKAVNQKLIDRVAYRQDFMETLKLEYKSEFIDINDYAATIKETKKSIPTIAFLVIDGVIDSGNSSTNPIKGEAIVGSQSILKQLDEIVKDKNVKALIVRVNSPGGSYSASNEIWYALKKVKEIKKMPIIISMSNYAASGGYFIALAGDKILAEPSTITGSIGVLGGKMVFKGLWDKLGLSWGEIKFGDNAGILSVNHNFTASEKEIFNKSLDNVYKDFTMKVSQARNIEITSMDKIARGRIWTGIDALEVGLIDEIGGIDKAIAIAKKEANIKPKDIFNITYFPKPKSWQEKISEVLNGGPQIYVRKIMMDLGVNLKDVKTIQRLEHDAVMIPFKVSM